MTASIHCNSAPRPAGFIWVNLTGATHTALCSSAAGKYDVHGVREPTLISAAIQARVPLFLCFEFDQPDAPGMAALAHIRCAHPSLPILMIVEGHSHAVALWALRIRVWDLLVKPVSNGELNQRIGSLIEMTRQRGREPSRDIRFPSQVSETEPNVDGPRTQSRTQPAITHVTTHFATDITLASVAALCRLSPSRFCHVFRQEHGMSFGHHLLQYRLARACQYLSDPTALAKEAAYAVGFNDLSYFTRAFKRQIGVPPSKYRLTARLS